MGGVESPSTSMNTEPVEERTITANTSNDDPIPYASNSTSLSSTHRHSAVPNSPTTNKDGNERAISPGESSSIIPASPTVDALSSLKEPSSNSNELDSTRHNQRVVIGEDIDMIEESTTARRDDSAGHLEEEGEDRGGSQDEEEDEDEDDGDGDGDGDGEGNGEEDDDDGTIKDEEMDIVTDIQKPKKSTRKQVRGRKKGWTNVTPAQKRKHAQKLAASKLNASLESTPVGSPRSSGQFYDEYAELINDENARDLGVGSSRHRPVLAHLIGRGGAGSKSGSPGIQSPLLGPGAAGATGPNRINPLAESGQRTPYPDHALAKPFALYEAPKPRNIEEEENEEAKANAAAIAKRKALKGKANKEMTDVAEDEKDDRLYCICNKLYDADRTMIACDKCENWYHLDCVKIPEHIVELVDWFFCPPCVETYGKKTTWKPRCARPTCARAVVPLSKYCSDFCGLEMAVTRLEVKGTDPERYWAAVRGARKRFAVVLQNGKEDSGRDSRIMPDEDEEEEDKRFYERCLGNGEEDEEDRKKKWNSWIDPQSRSRQEEEDSITSNELGTKLNEVEERRRVLETQREMVDARLTYLKIAIKRWEALCQATADALAQEGMEEAIPPEEDAPTPPTREEEEKTEMAAPKRKNTKATKPKVNRPKKPVLAINLPEAQCGFDSRIVLDDEEWVEWLGSDEAKAILDKGELEQREGSETPRSVNLDDAELQNVCMWPRKECPRHQAWQKVREADFQVERAVIERRLEKLTVQEFRLKAQVADHTESVGFRTQSSNRHSNPLCVRDQMKTPTKRTPSKKRLARSLITGEDPFPEAKKNPYVLFPGLERVEEDERFEVVGGLGDVGKGKRKKFQKKR